MNKAEKLSKLQGFKQRISDEIIPAYSDKGKSIALELFSEWRTQLSNFLDANLPDASSKLQEKLSTFDSFHLMIDSYQDFEQTVITPCQDFIFVMINKVKNEQNGDSNLSTPPISPGKPDQPKFSNYKRVFLVHGHDELSMERTARFIEKLGFEVVILNEQANRGRTIIEKLEAYTDVGFAIVLYTPDDMGYTNEVATNCHLQPRARQNVIFEHGYLLAKLGRSNVVSLVSEKDIELPSDISGVVCYIGKTDWKLGLAMEMQQAGYSVDLNKINES